MSLTAMRQSSATLWKTLSGKNSEPVNAVGGKGHGGGYWVYVKGSRGGGKEHGKRYTLQKAKQIVAMMRAEGLDAYYTSGKRPNHTLQRAYQSAKGKIINRAKQIFGELGG